jgi:C-terminal processing protease CtpA/Prc
MSTSLVVVLLFGGLLMAGKADDEERFQALGNLAEVVHLVLTEYVDEVDQEGLALSLEAGLVESVDPWAAVLPPDSAAAYQEMYGAPPPFGLELSLRLGTTAVRHVCPGSPAEAAGLVAWEVIERLDGVNTRGRPLWQVRLELAERARAGEPVTLTVMDRVIDERREVVLEPTAWRAETLQVEDLDGGPRVVRVLGLPAGAAAEIERAVTGRDDVILDLRDLLWGLETEAIQTVDLFVGEGTLGAWQGRRAGEESFAAGPEVALPSPPIVLVGPDTEGVGEILASGLRRGSARLVGGVTMGHAPHMRMIRDGDLVLWLPVAHWLRWDDTPIHRTGLEPDEAVAAAAEDEDGDPVLERAVQMLSEVVDQAA